MMAHFAKVTNGIVVQVIVAEKEFFDTFIDTTPGEWIQTSYNTRYGLHYDQNGQQDGVGLRANFAGVGYIYDRVNDVFYPPQPYPSWTISAPFWEWKAPIDIPSDNKTYTWNETSKSWVEQI
jgi:hypothetical protein